MDLRAFLHDAHGDLCTRLFRQVIDIVPADRWHEQVDGGGSSLAWVLLHLTRHQDLAVSTAVRNHPPLYLAHRDALGLSGAPASAGIGEREDRDVSTAVAPPALRAYVEATFDATAAWLDTVALMAFDSVPDTADRLTDLAGLSADEMPWFYDMWAGKRVDWFVQWPVLGHGQNHTGEAIALRNRLGLSPF
jgi:DinB superfamily